VVAGIFALLICLGMGAAGVGYVRTSRSMRSYATTRGKVISRDVVQVHADSTPKFGSGGNYVPKPTYSYTVAGTTYTNDRVSYAHRPVKQEIAKQRVDAMPAEVDVHYDPDNPQESYLEKHRSGLGWSLIILGCVIALIALVAMLG
jgi:hypothetical protein